MVLKSTQVKKLIRKSILIHYKERVHHEKLGLKIVFLYKFILFLTEVDFRQCKNEIFLSSLVLKDLYFRLHMLLLAYLSELLILIKSIKGQFHPT